ncbi:SdiA-regulated domain-containing protein [Maricurvus nonylphenolicus]
MVGRISQSVRRRPLTSSVSALVSAALIVALIPLNTQAIIQTGPRMELESYQLAAEPVVIDSVAHNASGITYNPDTNTLFAVVNNPEILLELTLEGELLRKIPLEGFHDTEGLTYLGEGRYAVTEETRRSIVIIDTLDGLEVLERDMYRSIAIPFAFTKHNRGFEGITVDPQTGSLFVVNEKRPRSLLQVDGLLDPTQLGINFSIPWDMESRTLGNTDLAGLQFLSQTNHLLILSEESKRVTEVDIEGNTYGYLDLDSGDAGLNEAIEQPEGVTVDADGDLYILSEPNLLYRFSRS